MTSAQLNASLTEMAKLSRTRGHSFERDCVKRWREIYNDAMSARAGDRSKDSIGIDIINTGEWSPQCKRKRKFSVYKLIEEVQEGTPILHIRGDNKKGLVVLYEDDFFNLLR